MLIVSLLLVPNAAVHCTTLVNGCCDLRSFSPEDVPNGVYNMSLGTFASANIYCDMVTDGGGWIVIQRNRKGSPLSFNKNWREYEDGFGNVREDFWAGLKLMNALTQRGQWEMRVDFQDNKKAWHYLHYNQFSVGSPSTEYRLAIGGYTGGSGDYFTKGNEPAANAKFTTYDNDNDVDNSRNCAVTFGSGWWHYSCFDINPNHQPPYSDWPTRVLFMEMKIRPKGCIM